MRHALVQTTEAKTTHSIDAAIESALQECIKNNKELARFEDEAETKTACRLIHFLDSIELEQTSQLESALKKANFHLLEASIVSRTFFLPGHYLPKIVLKDSATPFMSVSMRVENIGDFFSKRGLFAIIEGSPCGLFRKALISRENGISFWAVERKLATVTEATEIGAEAAIKRLRCKELWQTRPRNCSYEDSLDCLQEASIRAKEMAKEIGKAEAARLILEVEQQYWQAKNMAAQIQYNRQNSLGLGWQNCIQVTLRSSRKYHCLVVRLLEILGFCPCSSFYHGENIGVSTHCFEQPEAGIRILLEVDMSHAESHTCDPHTPLQDWPVAGPVDLWCALQGESLLGAGLYSLAIACDVESIKKDFQKMGFDCQAATIQDPSLCCAQTCVSWTPRPDRLKVALTKKLLSLDNAKKLAVAGFEGSKLLFVERELYIAT